VKLQNPLSSDFDALRGSLLPGLLGNVQANERQGRRDVALYEIGRVFASAGSRDELPREELRMAFAIAGSLRPPHWSERTAVADFFTAKGLLEALAAHLGAAFKVGDVGALPAFLHPGRAALVEGKAGAIGFLGVLHPEAQKALDLRDQVVVDEVSLEGFFAFEAEALRARSLEKFPAVTRDLSLLCAESLRASDLVATIRAAGGPWLRSVEIRDRYVGDPVPKGRVSLTVGLRFQESSRTLTGEEVQAAVEGVVLALRGAGAEIRGEAGG
jgi:phenylalanyl-tRNA synthetase beta chain